MSFDFFASYQSALTYEEFLERFGTQHQVLAWSEQRSKVHLGREQVELLGAFRRKIHVLCMAGTWCGDCVQQCPILDVFEKASDAIDIRYVNRDADPQLKSELTICGGSRVPQLVFLSETGDFVSHRGDRTLTRYRELVAGQLGESLPGSADSNPEPGPQTGSGGEKVDPVLAGVVRDWLDEFERVQWILRLSPKLRELHGD